MRAYKRKDRQVKALLVLLLIVIIISSFLLYSYDLQAKSLELTIEKFQNVLRIQAEAIENRTIMITNLQHELRVSDLLIDDLGSRLGIAQSEVRALTPIIKQYYAVAVRSNSGVVIPFEVKLTNGTGLVSVNIRNVDLQSGTQDSIRVAVAVAEMQTKTDLSNRDVTVSFINDQQEIVSLDGPSAGAVITTAIIAAIQNKTLDSTVLATGTINPDGSIGLVGGVAEKAAAASSFGARIFIVPYGEKVYSNIEVIEAKNIIEVTSLVLK